ncbi:hypothetical protein PJ985_14810 [Streptomyces sp. ACA25]|uniref:trypsin-like serine peptidase n=1 Tax=Streptomyces sp. ACA25 TaxID=3022596 RepID=UPI0023077E15|nr:hypothetical protein [Streptomyces sp. ACA25]MDB1088837.1 hypothetical protein [Streptomyces sp. ACA25]
MASIRRRPAGRRVAFAAAAAAVVLALTASACGPGDDDASNDGKGPEASPGTDLGEWQELLDQLPIDIDIDAWMEGGWADWEKDEWLSEAGQYISIIIDDFWDSDRMREAEDRDKSIDEDDIDEGAGPGPGESSDPADDRGATDPTPAPVDAVAVDTPYNLNAAVVGKVFMETPDGPMVCSGAVVKDPGNPGTSNLVATAGHCVHAGAEGGWFRNIAFAPAYNDRGADASELESMPFEEQAPYGIWWTDLVGTTDYWVENGTDEGGNGAHQDFAVMRVQPEDGGGASLEESVGAAVDINFQAPAVSGLGATQVYGYPAAPPFDGMLMYQCSDQPTRLSLDWSEPVMYRVGCTMTGGSSGGPWLAQGSGGDPELISVTSIGPYDSTWLAGPRLEDEAQGVFDEVRTSP